MNSNKKQKIILAVVIILELVVGFLFLYNFYQQKIVHKFQNSDKITTIKKESLIFPEESEFKYYYKLQPNIEYVDNPDWLGHEVKYTYNADGLHDRFDYQIEKANDVFRIITLGDSFTFGQYVNTKDNWTEQLEDMLNNDLEIKTLLKVQKFEVINLGMAGWDIPYTVKRYKDIGAKYNPDLVIWFESGSGFMRLTELFRPMIDNFVKECKEHLAKVKLESKDETYYCYSAGWEKAKVEFQDKYSYEDSVELITKYLDDLFFTFNSTKILFFTFNDFLPNDRRLATLRDWQARYTNVTFYSTVPYVNSLGKVFPDGHPDEAGHEIIANSIYEHLKIFVLK